MDGSEAVVIVASLWIRDGREAEYIAFEREAVALMQRFGGVLDDVVRMERSEDGGDSPSEIHLVRFPNRAAFDRYRTDPSTLELAERRNSVIERTEIRFGRDAGWLEKTSVAGDRGGGRGGENAVVAIRRANANDAAQVARFAEGVFTDTFGPDNTAEDMENYISTTFTPDRMRTTIADSGHTVLVAEAGDAMAAYAHLADGPSPECITGPAPIELRRFYVEREWHGRGVAQQLMEAVLAVARDRGKETLWLGVWERNPRAIAFYSKYGFERVGEYTFMLGSDAQTDWLLARPLG